MEAELRDEIVSLFRSDASSAGDEQRAQFIADRIIALLGRTKRLASEKDADLLAFLAASREDLGSIEQEQLDLLLREMTMFDPDIAQTWSRLTTRMTELDSSSDAAAHFERLSGRRLGPSGRVREPGTERPATERPGMDRHGTERPGTDRPATQGPGPGAVSRCVDTGVPGEVPSNTPVPEETVPVSRARPLFLVRTLAAAASIVVLVGVTGRLMDSPEARAAHSSLLSMGALRGAIPGMENDADIRHDAAGDLETGWIRRAAASRSLWLGLWPRYDVGSLQVIEREILTAGDSTGSALLILGKVRLMKEDRIGARAAITASAVGGNPEARKWLERLAGSR